ncbi:MAG: GNAT family N-acetyltransferase [Eubacteriales bacterium]
MLNHKGTKTLATERLLLRPFIVEDAPDMYRNWASDPRVTKYVTWNPHRSADETKQLLELWTSRYADSSYYNWTMTLDGHAIGNLEVVGTSDRNESMELGYCMSVNFWNRGYMTEAVSAIRDFLFGEVGAHRLVIRHAVQNPASGKVARKCGFTWEGQQRGAIFSSDGEPMNIECYSLLRDEWECLRNAAPQTLLLDTPRLTLRPACIGDFDAVHAYAGSPENTHYMIWGTNDEKTTRSFLVNCEKAWSCRPVRNYEFVMVGKETGRVIGGCGLYLEENGQAELGWIVHRDSWKQGFAAEAGRAMADYAFGTLGLRRLRARCDAENYGSWRVMEKLGMRREAEFHEVRLCRGEWHDEYEYAILKEEWQTAHDIAYYNSLPYRFDGFADLPPLTDGVIELVCREKRPAKPEKKYAPSYEFEIRKDGQSIGYLSLRIGYTEGLYYGGQIGYGVDEAYRGNGYAGRACRLAARAARIHGMEKLLIANDVSNKASRRVCEKLGLRHIRTVRLPEDTELYREGHRFENIFEYDISAIDAVNVPPEK